jgi:hypothetical protein
VRDALLNVAIALGLAGAASAQTNVKVWTDPAGDATLRLTDPGADGIVLDDATVPDLVSATLAGWLPFDPLNNPFLGLPVPGDSANIVRITLTFKGLVNPPGPLGLNGEDYDPFRFGPNPVYGFLDIDVDADIDTGGVLGGAATQRYLANIARFRRVPTGSLAPRAAKAGSDLDANFESGPQYERSGADFDVSMCGCWSPTIVTEGGDADGTFDEGETWIVRGRFLERVQGYKGASMAVNGSDFFLYDPLINVRYAHSTVAGTTTITIIFPLNMKGSSILTGQPEQKMDNDVSNQFSIAEALNDVILTTEGGLPQGPTKVLAQKWAGRNALDYINPLTWRVTALFGMPYEVQDDAFYAWTDTGFAETYADLNGDGKATSADDTLLVQGVYAFDGGPSDADGAINGVVVVKDPGVGFLIYDLDDDGEVKLLDRYVYANPADLNADGSVDLLDFITFQQLVHSGDLRADFNLDQKIDVFDFIAFQAAASK